MKNYDWAGCKVEVDEIATREWYAQAEVYDCPCGHCRNFMAQLADLPREMLNMLADAGISPEKVAYVCELYHEKDRLYYQVVCPLAGRVLQKVDESGRQTWGSIVCHEEMPYPRPRRELPQPHFALEFLLWLPWVLDEPING